MDEDQFEEALRNWNNGNYSDLDTAELIAIAQHFEQLFNQSLHKG